MLKGLREMLRIMGNALVLADAGEMLSGAEKNAVLGRFQGRYPAAPDAVPPRVVVASDRQFTTGIVEQGIALCHDMQAMLDLLCIAPGEGGGAAPLTEVLPRLVSETGLDFQVTRRQGDLLVEVDSYLRARRDTVLILLHVGAELRQRAERYRRRAGWCDSTGMPAVSLFEEVPGT